MNVRAEMLMIGWKALHAYGNPQDLNAASEAFLEVYGSAGWGARRDFWDAVVAERCQPDEARELGLSILKEVDTAIGFDGGKG